MILIIVKIIIMKIIRYNNTRNDNDTHNDNVNEDKNNNNNYDKRNHYDEKTTTITMLKN